ncbi:MAG: PilZ domain-containing protein [Candidatus Velthaea sp.]
MFLEADLRVFSWGKKASRVPQRARVVEQKRTAYRASVEFPVVYRLPGRAGSRGALATDLSAVGLRLIGDEDLPAATVVDVRFTLPTELVSGVHVEREVEEKTPLGTTKKKIMVPPAPFEAMALRGKVVITFFSVRRRKLSHGLQFIDVDDRTKEELQRFIHVWQVMQLRERAARE